MSWLTRIFKRGPTLTLPADQAARLAVWQARPAVDLQLSHYRSRYVVVDVEASGLNMGKDHLIAIGAVAVTNGVIDPEDSFEVILKQDVVSDTDNILIHGIGGQAQRGGVAPEDALLAYLEYVGRDPLVAYHALFDKTMIERAMQRYLGQKTHHAWIDLAWVVPELYRDLLDGHVGLDQWLALFDIENIQRHNAVSDAMATAMLLQVAMAKAAARGSESPQSFIEIEKARRWLRRSA